MEAFLRQHQQPIEHDEGASSSDDDRRRLTSALSALADALKDVLPILSSASSTTERDHVPSNNDDVVSASWLLHLCQRVPSELGPLYLAECIWDMASSTDVEEASARLFDVLGASDPAMQVLQQVLSVWKEIARSMSKEELAREYNNQHGMSAATTFIESDTDLDEARRQSLWQEAMDAAQLAELAEQELADNYGNSSYENNNNHTTHVATSKAQRAAQKLVEKHKKRAAVAWQRAKDAGAVVDDSAFALALDASAATVRGPGGLMNQTSTDGMLSTLQQDSSLLPDGSKQYYNQYGLPKGTIIDESHEDYAKAVVPPAHRDESELPTKLHVSDIMSPTCQQAFAGTTTLNPMQSSVFEVAFFGRENMLVCAPTGAGKTNVAMLTVVAHFRDVGLIVDHDTGDRNDGNILETGKKVVYIAPMKALAQEVVEKFSSKLKSLRLIVRELTGDMQLTRAEAESAHVIVTTPEKWDVVSRKAGTDELSLGNQCGLLIIDEVHLLADERGAVIESVVARHHRLVESRQRQLRIVALSATLPNYQDVASFLQVPERGMFFFGPEHRPVPLQQTLIGMKDGSRDRNAKETKMNKVCYDIVLDSLRRGYQVMVFVHSRKGTGDTARALADIAKAEGKLDSHFITAGKDDGEAYGRYTDKVRKSRDRQVGMHFQNGMGIHHAGMLRGDRKLTENMFSDGAIKVLCCTATLAWGVNLPAHSVVIKGTEVYNPEKGGTVDLSILDVQQIFGRAGRPQFDSSGEATLITTYEAYQRYLDKLVKAVPIESNFIKQLPDHLNAEVVNGTVTTIQEAVQWLTYTYLYIRMLRNPLAYGITADEKIADSSLQSRCKELVVTAAKLLDDTRMARFNVTSGNLAATEYGRTAAQFYVQAESVATFNELMERGSPTYPDLFRIICSANEFKNMKVRQEELDELQKIAGTCPLELAGAGLDDAGKGLITSATDKAFIMMQAYISRAKVNSFTLISDVNYISANGGRIARALFEMCIKDGDAASATKLLRIAKSVDNRIWFFHSPLRHFEGEMRDNALFKLEQSKRVNTDSLEYLVSLLDMQPREVGELCHWSKGGDKVQSLIRLLPRFDVDCQVLPLTAGILKFQITLSPAFRWNGRWHGGGLSFWMWIENVADGRVYHCEQLTLTKRNFPDPLVVAASVPTFGKSGQYMIRILSDSWVGAEQVITVPFNESMMPKQDRVITKLQDLTPLPTNALQNPDYEQLYPFESFNPIQTQLFHVLYHTDSPVLLGAPTGSGKTIIAEIALLRLKRLRPSCICVYIAPLKALARERLKEWQRRLGKPPLSWRVLELSGDTHYDMSVLERADVLVCTPEKWDLLSRGWRGMQTGELQKEKGFIKRVGLLILDEVHLLGEARGAVLEAIVSRTRFISRLTQKSDMEEYKGQGTRIIGLSTALANAVDLAAWMGIETEVNAPTKTRGLYNFPPSVRPVPVVVHVQGFSGKHYCPRMATMNKPCFAAIKDYAPTKPTLIFVASRRQTRLTAFDLISYAASDDKTKSFLNCGEDFIESMAENIRDESLRHTITFGVGLHHAGLSTTDRDVVEKLFLNGQIRVLVATATLAWGVNLPAHLVIVKGTEYFDGKLSRYVDYPLTDVLQMIGRAGRPGFDTSASAVVMTTDDKRAFYNKFLYEPFPVESCLRESLCENMNAEIAGGTISSMFEAMGYLTWTFFARRVKANPSYYGAKTSDDDDVEEYFLQVVKETLTQLKKGGCIVADVDDESTGISTSPLGIACASYYLDYRTPKQVQLGIREGRRIVFDLLQEVKSTGTHSFARSLSPLPHAARLEEVACAWLLYTLCSIHQFDEHPVRHNEEFLNEQLSRTLMWGPDTTSLLSNGARHHLIDIFQDPHTKCFLLIQAYLQKAKLPITDYVNDTMTVVDNVPRLLAAMEYIACKEEPLPGSLEFLTQFYKTKQCLATRSVPGSDPLLQLPGVTKEVLIRLQQAGKQPIGSLGELRAMPREAAMVALNRLTRIRKEVLQTTLDLVYQLPLVTLKSSRVYQQIVKATGKFVGKVDLELDIHIHDKGRKSSHGAGDSDLSLTILIGTYQQKIYLGQTSVRLKRHGNLSVSRTIDFDWSRANADGGADGGRLTTRLLFDKVRGLDMEIDFPLA